MYPRIPIGTLHQAGHSMMAPPPQRETESGGSRYNMAADMAAGAVANSVTI